MISHHESAIESDSKRHRLSSPDGPFTHMVRPGPDLRTSLVCRCWEGRQVTRRLGLLTPGGAPAHPVEMEYWTIEVLDGELSALRWRDAYGDALVEAAHTNLVLDWRWSEQPWGVALELGFADESAWLRFRSLAVVRAALDAVPDRLSGVLIYPGRGGSQGSMVPRRPRPAPASGVAEVPAPLPHLELDIAARMEPAPFAPA